MVKCLGPGEKIKRLRLAMGLTQDDLTNDQLSKSIISMIESNKRKVTWHTAHIIADCLNTYYEAIGTKITADYLMEAEEDEAKKMIKENIDELEKAMGSGSIDHELVENTFDKVINLVDQWGLEEEKRNLKILRGNFYYDNYQYQDALKEFLDVLEYSIRIRDYRQVGRMYNSIGNIYQIKFKVDTALLYYGKALETAETYLAGDKEKLKIYSVYNLILCYGKIKRYDLVLEHIKVFKEIEGEDPLFLIFLNRVMVIEGNTYRDMRNDEKALGIYKYLLNHVGELDKDTQILLYDNFAQLYRQQGNPQEALIYLKKANEVKDDGINLHYLPSLYLMEAKCYHLLEKYDLVINLLENALKLAIKLSNQSIILDIHFAFADVYLGIKDYKTALIHLQTVEKFMIQNNIDIHRQELYSFYCDVYLGLGNKIKVSEYLSKMRSKYLTD